MPLLNPDAYACVTTEKCLASSVGGGKDLRYWVVVEGNTAHYKVTNHKKTVYEGPSSVIAANAYNQVLTIA